jgi:Periplasmic component of the Tol biopolymer transport system
MIILLLSQWSFGQNKVEYKDIKWKVLDTEHFKIYHYQGGESLADFAALVLEEAFSEFKEFFPGAIKSGEKIPVLIYVSYKDFQQTNVMPYIVPEGVGGFTEGFKKRIVVPFAGNYEEFRHVLRHELVHAFQFGYSRGLSGIMNQSQPPQWFIEGMAEYLAQPWSLRTEVYLRDLVVNLRLPSLEEINQYYGYISYRYGHAFFKFLEETYGEKAVKDFIRMGLGGNVDLVLNRITGKNLAEVSEEFSVYIKGKVLRVFGQYVFPQDAKRITNRRDNSFMNVGATISPDGSYIAFISDRKGRMGIWVLNLANRKLRMIQEGERSPDFENLHVLKPSLSISGGNFLAVISQGTYSDILSIYDLRNFKRVKRFELRGFDGAHSGELSPDGKKFVFVGYRSGIPDIFVLDVQTGDIRNITNDEFTEDDPSWFDDSTIIFVSDKNEEGKIGSYSIFKKTLSGREERVWGYRKFLKKPKRVGDRIVFIAEYNGCANLFSFENGKTKILTEYFTEIGDYDVSEGGRWVMSALWEGDGTYFCF